MSKGPASVKTEQAFIDAATRLFAQKGYKATSITDLSEALNLTTASLYYYVNGKQDLLARVLQEGMVDFLSRLEAIADSTDSPLEKVTHAVDNHLDFVLNHSDVVVIFNRYRRYLADEPREHYQSVLDRYERLFTDILQNAMDAGAIATGDARLIRLATLGMINSTVEWFRPDGRLTADEIKAQMSSLIIGRLLAAKA